MLQRANEIYMRVTITILEKYEAIPPLYKAAFVLAVIYNVIIHN